MTDWSDSASRRLERRNGNGKNPAGTALWDQVRCAVEENVRALNTRQGKDVLIVERAGSQTIRVHSAVNCTTLEADFDGQSLTWKCGTKHDHWYVSAGDDGCVVFKGMGVPINPGSMVKQMMDPLID